MKVYLNTLFITTQGTYLHKERETIVVEVKDKQRIKLPIHNIGSIICFGNVLCSPFLLSHCAENGVAVSFITEYGKFLGRFTGPVSGNVLLRREQYRWADDERSIEASRFFIMGKLLNSKNVLNRFVRDHKSSVNIEDVKQASKMLTRQVQELRSKKSLDEIRGCEGYSATVYFNVFDSLILVNKDSFFFKGRNKRPPLDRVNAMLSFIYVIIMHDIRGALETVGLDPSVGFLHRDRPGRYGLALDLMEEFRSFLADRLVLTLINRKQILPIHFNMTESGAVLLNDKGRKIMLTAYQDKKKEEITHNFIEEKILYGTIFYVQTMLLARWIRGDIDGYPAFIWK